MTEKTSSTKTFEYKAEMNQLLHLIVHSLYVHPEVFLRELISNASDALNKARCRELTEDILDKGKDLAIRISVDKDKQWVSVQDNGIGMTEQELIDNIGTVAKSGTLEFLSRLKEEGKPLDAALIGQFGVGFYSVFMVADEVVIETRSAQKDALACRWVSSGEGGFTIEPMDKPDRGTKISFKLKDNAKEFAEPSRIKEIITKYSNFADFPIFLGEERVNTVRALWRESQSEIKPSELQEFYKFISNDYDAPLGHLHVSIESVGASFKALIFIPKHAPFNLMQIHEQKSLHLYANKILIQDDCKDLLPEYLRFCKGVVDTPDLPLNVSREVTQSSPVMAKIRSTLTTKILTLLKSWANKDQEKYMTFYKNFGPLFKTGLNTDFINRDKIIELLRFESSRKKPGEFISLKQYVEGMKENQTEIYYLSGEDRTDLENNPNLEYFKKNNIEVLLLSDPVDVFIVPSIQEYDKKPIKSIEKADLDLLPQDKIETKEDNLSKSLLGLFKEVLGDKIEDAVASRRLVDSAVTLVTGKDGLDPQMEKMMRRMNKDLSVPAFKKILEVNMDHPVVKNLSRLYLENPSNPLLRKCVEQLYDSAVLIEGDLTTTSEFVRRMTEIMEEATK